MGDSVPGGGFLQQGLSHKRKPPETGGKDRDIIRNRLSRKTPAGPKKSPGGRASRGFCGTASFIAS